MPAIQPRIAALLDRWKADRAYPAMTYDGVVGDEATYAKSRIVFLLKETPDPDFAELITPGPEQGWGPDGGVRKRAYISRKSLRVTGFRGVYRARGCVYGGVMCHLS